MTLVNDITIAMELWQTEDMSNSGIFAAQWSFISSIVLRIEREENYHLLTKAREGIIEKWYKN